MNAIGLWGLLLMGGLSGASAAEIPATETIAARAIREAMPLGTVPALAVLEIRAGHVTSSAVAGVREVNTSSAARLSDQWHLGSDAKPMTAMLVQMLVDRHKLKWSDRLVDRLPALKHEPGVYADVTLMDLATHISGLPENSDTQFLLTFYKDKRPLPVQRLAYLKRALRDAPERPRGQYGYSNTGFIALGAVAEHVAQRPYEQLMREMIFRPLAMRTAGFGPTARGNPLYHEGGRAVVGPMGDNPLIFAPAGGIHMSLGDWSRWAIDQLNGAAGKGKLMAGSSYRFLQRGRVNRPGKDTVIAMDWGVTQQPFGTFLYHNGSNGGWFALIGLAPGLGNGVLVAANGAEDMKGDVVTGHAMKTVIKSWPATPK